MKTGVIILVVVIVALAIYFVTKKNKVNNGGEWSVYHGSNDGKPMVIRAHEKIYSKENVELFPFQIGIAVPLVAPDANGFPSSDEAQRLDEIEDELLVALGSNSESLDALVISTGGMREFIYYAKEWKPEYFEAKVKSVNAKFPEHELQFMMKKDPSWETFRLMLKK